MYNSKYLGDPQNPGDNIDSVKIKLLIESYKERIQEL